MKEGVFISKSKKTNKIKVKKQVFDRFVMALSLLINDEDLYKPPKN